MSPDLQDDAACLAAMAQGDVRAARHLSNRLTRVVFAHAIRLVGNAAVAEDVTQEALIRLWKIAPDWDPQRAKVTTWLYRVTANLCMDHLRKKAPLGSDAVPELADDHPSVVQQLQTKARMDALQVALMELPERQRQAVILRHIEGLGNPDIAQIMDLSVEAVESLTSRGKRALAKLLSPQKAELGYKDEGV